MRVIVTSRLKLRNYETKEGEKRTVYEVEVDDVGPSPRNASAKVTRAKRRGQGRFSGGSGGQSSSGGSRTQDRGRPTPATPMSRRSDGRRGARLADYAVAVELA